jgi:hypothetical protein
MCLQTRLRVWSCALAIAVFSAFAGVPSAQAQAESTREDFAFSIVNPCTDETILFEGTVHNVARGEPTEPHGFNFSLVGTGVSDTGAHYVFISVANGQTTFPEGEPGFPPPPDRAAGDAFTSVGRLLVIRQGSASPADDQSFFALDHITATPDGEITAIKITFDEHCQ